MSAKHSETPFTEHAGGTILDANGRIVAHNVTTWADATYIVRCVNSHEALIGALTAIAQQATSESNGYDKLNQIAQIADSALSLARGGGE